MRKVLDGLYGAALAGACLAMAAIATMVLLQIGGRIVDRAADLMALSRPGFSIPSLAEIGGYLFAASTFLALPATLKSGTHVRVTLALKPMTPRVERMFTSFVLIVALVLTAFATFYLGAQALTAWQRGSVSYGLIPIPLWIPQAFMTAGLGIFALSLLDELLLTLTGGLASFRKAETLRETKPDIH